MLSHDELYFTSLFFRYVGRGDDRSDVESVGNPADAREGMAREGKEARHPVGRMEQGDKGGMLYGEMDAV